MLLHACTHTGTLVRRREVVNCMCMVYVCRRRFLPKELLLNFLDAMSYVKMNVFHWHLSDYCIYSIESKVYVLLHVMCQCSYIIPRNHYVFLNDHICFNYNMILRTVFTKSMHISSRWIVSYPLWAYYIIVFIVWNAGYSKYSGSCL